MTDDVETAVEEDEDVSLFGDMDTDDIPDDPFFVMQGTYYGSCTDAKIVRSRKDESQALFIQYTIDEPDSDYHGYTVSDYFTLYLDRDFKDLDANEKKTVIRMRARFREGFDVAEDRVKYVKPSDLMGEPVYIQVTNSPGKGEHTGKTFTNVGKVQSKRLYEEQNETKADESAGSFGL
jgi:hypothetical protein